MLANCALLTAILMIVGVVLLAGHVRLPRSLARSILIAYAWPFAAIVAVIFVNLLALVYAVARRLLLKDTGRKLAHVERQLRTRDTIVRDLSERLSQED